MQVGNSSNTTHLQDTTGSTVVFDNTRSITSGGTNSARFITLGTKIGTGNRATGVRGGVVCLGGVVAGTVPLSGTTKLYGATIRQTSGALTWTPASDGTGEAVNVLFQSTASGTAPFNIGATDNRLANLYNCDFSHITTAQVASNINALAAERITVGSAAPTALVSSGAASVCWKDLALFGTPTQSDLRWATSNATMWGLVRPVWSNNAPKFSFPGGQVSPDINSPTVEFWQWNVKVVGAAGEGLEDIPVKLTDSTGLLQVDTLTDANGEVTFQGTHPGGDLSTLLLNNAVAVADWYISSGAATIRHRSPFLVEVNYGENANPGYPARRYYHNWAGKETVTNSAGTFADMNDVISLQDPSGAYTNWTECELP